MSDLEDNYTKTLKNISNLQIAERDLYTQLEKLTANGNANTDLTAQNDIINKINYLSNTRIELFKNLAYNYRSTKQSAINSKYDVIDQITVLKMVEDQLNKSKQYINNIESSNMHQMRMVEINSYYSKRYSNHTKLIKIIIVVSIIVLLVILLKKYNILSPEISNVFIMIILFIGINVFVFNGYDLFKRNNMDYDEYDIISKPKTTSSDTSYNNKSKTSLSDMGSDMGLSMGCVNGSCCSTNMIYNSEKNKCVVMQPETFTTLELNNNNTKNESNNNNSCTSCKPDKTPVDKIHDDIKIPMQPIETIVKPFTGFSNFTETSIV